MLHSVGVEPLQCPSAKNSKQPRCGYWSWFACTADDPCKARALVLLDGSGHPENQFNGVTGAIEIESSELGELPSADLSNL